MIYRGPLARLPARPTVRSMFIVLLAGCASATPSRSPPVGEAPRSDLREAGRVITSPEITRTGARTAWEALERAYLGVVTRGDESGGARRLALRGRSSLPYAIEPIVILDGAVVQGTAVLRYLSAADVASIRVLSAADATHRYGPGASMGAIVVQTRRGGG